MTMASKTRRVKYALASQDVHPFKLSCAVARVGSKVWSADSDGSISILNAETGLIENEIEAVPSMGMGNGATTNVDGRPMCMVCAIRRVWIGYADGALRIFHAETADMLNAVAAHSDAITAICVCNSFVCTASMDGSIGIWDQADLDLRHQVHGHEGAVRCLCAHPEASALPISIEEQADVIGSVGGSAMLFSGGDDGVLRCWNLMDFTTRAFGQSGSSGSVRALAIHGENIWAATSDSVSIWNTSSFTKVHTIQSAVVDEIRSLIVVSDAVWLCDAEAVSVWDAKSFQMVKRIAYEGGVASLAHVLHREVITVWAVTNAYSVAILKAEASLHRQASSQGNNAGPPPLRKPLSDLSPNSHVSSAKNDNKLLLSPSFGFEPIPQVVVTQDQEQQSRPASRQSMSSDASAVTTVVASVDQLVSVKAAEPLNKRFDGPAPSACPFGNPQKPPQQQLRSLSVETAKPQKVNRFLLPQKCGKPLGKKTSRDVKPKLTATATRDSSVQACIRTVEPAVFQLQFCRWELAELSNRRRLEHEENGFWQTIQHWWLSHQPQQHQKTIKAESYDASTEASEADFELLNPITQSAPSSSDMLLGCLSSNAMNVLLNEMQRKSTQQARCIISREERIEELEQIVRDLRCCVQEQADELAVLRADRYYSMQSSSAHLTPSPLAVGGGEGFRPSATPTLMVSPPTGDEAPLPSSPLARQFDDAFLAQSGSKPQDVSSVDPASTSLTNATPTPSSACSTNSSTSLASSNSCSGDPAFLASASPLVDPSSILIKTSPVPFELTFVQEMEQATNERNRLQAEVNRLSMECSHWQYLWYKERLVAMQDSEQKGRVSLGAMQEAEWLRVMLEFFQEKTLLPFRNYCDQSVQTPKSSTEEVSLQCELPCHLTPTFSEQATKMKDQDDDDDDEDPVPVPPLGCTPQPVALSPEAARFAYLTPRANADDEKSSATQGHAHSAGGFGNPHARSPVGSSVFVNPSPRSPAFLTTTSSPLALRSPRSSPRLTLAMPTLAPTMWP